MCRRPGVEFAHVYVRRFQQLNVLAFDSQAHKKLSRQLYDLQMKTMELLPNVELKSGEVKRIGTQPIEVSVHYDIWDGVYLDSVSCVVKVLRRTFISSLERSVSITVRIHNISITLNDIFYSTAAVTRNDGVEKSDSYECCPR